jgi:phage terminase small subunit
MSRALGDVTPRETAFVVAYLTNGLDKDKAAIAAGYRGTPRSVARKVLMRKEVQMFVKEYLEAAEKKLGITVEWKMKVLKSMVKANVKNLDSEEPEIGNYKAALGSIQELNKMSGDYAPVRVENDNKHTFDAEEFQDVFNQCDEAYKS